MPVVMNMRWAGVTPEQYDACSDVVDWESDVPNGAIYHVVSFDDAGIVVTDVWETAEAFQEFVDSRLMPGVQQVGIAGEPDVVIRPVHDVFAPGYGISLPDQRGRENTIRSVVTEVR